MANNRGTYKARGNKKRSRFYLLLSLIFIVVMAKWGAPMLLDLVANGGGSRIGGGEENDVIPPQKPVFSALPEATNSAQVKISGFTEAGAEVTLWLNENNAETVKADETGGFDFNPTLTKGNNELYARAKDESGNESVSNTEKIVYDDEPLKIALDKPTPGQTFYGSTEQNMEIAGSVNKPDARIYINGSYISADSEGVFNQRLKLTEGENKITISSRDKAGYEDQTELTVTYVR
jgi:hypothetical protein